MTDVRHLPVVRSLTGLGLQTRPLFSLDAGERSLARCFPGLVTLARVSRERDSSGGVALFDVVALASAAVNCPLAAPARAALAPLTEQLGDSETELSEAQSCQSFLYCRSIGMFSH